MEKEPLEHAIRCWEAEVENAARIADRKTLIIGLPTGVLAFIGLKVELSKVLFHAVLDESEPSSVRTFAFAGLVGLFVSVAFLFVSVAVAIEVRRRRPAHRGLASRGLHPLTRPEVVSLALADDPTARAEAYRRTVSAARTLLKLNQAVEERLYDALAWLLSGVACTFLTVLAYALVVAKSTT